MTTSTTSIGADFAAIVARMERDAAALSQLTARGAWAQAPLASTADGVAVVHTSGALPAAHVSTKRWLEVATGIPLALRRLNVAEQPALDADGVDERSPAAYDEQQLTLVPVGDGYEVRGYLTKESAAVLLTVLEQKIDGWFHSGALTPEQQSPHRRPTRFVTMRQSALPIGSRGLGA
jgi:hypothetical protein